MSLEKDVGTIIGILNQLGPKVERALNNQEEAFKRLKDNEVKTGQNEVKIENLEKDMGGLKKISGFISAAIAVGINAFFRFILWKDQ